MLERGVSRPFVSESASSGWRSRPAAPAHRELGHAGGRGALTHERGYVVSLPDAPDVVGEVQRAVDMPARRVVQEVDSSRRCWRRTGWPLPFRGFLVKCYAGHEQVGDDGERVGVDLRMCPPPTIITSPVYGSKNPPWAPARTMHEPPDFTQVVVPVPPYTTP